jgi:hypothetical protein
MTDLPPQNYSNHRRFVPLFHFFALPVILLYVIYMIIHTVRAPFAWTNLAGIVFGVAVLTFALTTRTMVLKVQDRIIRMEMRLRLEALLPAETKTRIHELRPGQLVALRFASDAELPALVTRVLAGELSGNGIKRAITSWQGDHLRA